MKKTHLNESLDIIPSRNQCILQDNLIKQQMLAHL